MENLIEHKGEYYIPVSKREKSDCRNLSTDCTGCAYLKQRGGMEPHGCWLAYDNKLECNKEGFVLEELDPVAAAIVMVKEAEDDILGR